MGESSGQRELPKTVIMCCSVAVPVVDTMMILSGVIEHLPNGFDFASERGVFAQVLFNFYAAVADGAVVAPAKLLADFACGGAGLLAHQEHSHLSRHHDILVALFAAQGFLGDVIEIADAAHDLV